MGYPTAIVKKAALALGLIIWIAWIAPVLARAQSSIISQMVGDKAATDKLYFSLKFGLSCSTLKGTEDRERLGGFNFGLSATIKLAERLSLVPEVTPFSRKGVTEILFRPTGDPGLDPYFAEPTRSALILSYIDIPIQVTYRLGRINLGAGPFVGFLISAAERFRAELETGEELLYKKDVTGEYRNLDYGLILEASWIMAKPRRGAGLVFHIRYQAGLADILKDPAAPSSVRTSVIQVFFSFPFVR